MAYFGGTDNPLTANGGDTSAYNPAAVTSCGTSPTSGTCNGSSTNCFATTNDPGNLPLSGYAFLAADADQLNEQIKAAINIVREATYSFSQSSIQSTRTKDENFIYEGSFQPVANDPFWLGHLKKYSVNDDGTVGDSLWDAGTVLMNTPAASRNMKTYKGGSLVNFTTANITMEDLGVATNSTRDQVVGYFRGESAYNPDNWKLGDLFRSNPITVGSPSAYFEDFRDLSTPSAFSQHRTNHLRVSSDPPSGRIVVVGANDGQIHAFKTANDVTGGSEAWSFIPPNLLSRLKLIFHTAEPTSLSHQNYVDGPVTVADAWIPSVPGSGTSKLASDWHTLLIFGEGRGAGTNLWSSSGSCDSGFNPSYTPAYPYYCGYYCLDLNSSLNPVFKWRLGFSSSQAPYMGAPLSR
jgi:Tfp pilus tip-associated adhesin PilY1